MGSSERGGRLLLAGGHSARAWAEPEIVAGLARLSGGAGPARVVIASAVTEEGREPDEAARAALGRVGVVDVRALEMAGPDDAARARALAIVERATAIVFEGDDPQRLARLLRETPLDATIRRRLGDSLLVAGLGLVAPALAGRMLVDDVPDPDHGPAPERTEPIRGLAYLAGIVLDPFFFRDRRPDRLVSALAEGGGDLGLGIEEATALIVDRGVLRVLGRGSAMVVDVTSRAAEGLGGMAPIHTLRPGDRFDLAARAPLPPGLGPA